MDGFVTVTSPSSPGRWAVNQLRQYAQIMRCYTPDQVPVLNGLAREFGCSTTGSAGAVADVHEPFVLDCATCTLPTGGTVDRPLATGLHDNTAGRSSTGSGGPWGEREGRCTWRGDTGRFADRHHHWRDCRRFATNFVPFRRKDAAAGTLPTSRSSKQSARRSGDYHLAAGRLVRACILTSMYSSSILSGRSSSASDAYRNMRSRTTPTSVGGTFIGWDGRRHLTMSTRSIPPPETSLRQAMVRLPLRWSAARVPAIMVSPWVESGSVYNGAPAPSLLATMHQAGRPGNPSPNGTRTPLPSTTFSARPRRTPTVERSRATRYTQWQIDWEADDPHLEQPRQGGDSRTPGHRQEKGLADQPDSGTRTSTSRPSWPSAQQVAVQSSGRSRTAGRITGQLQATVAEDLKKATARG